MNERPFEDLHREIQARLEQRLEAIEADYRTRAEALEGQLTEQQRRQCDEARQHQRHRLQRERQQQERQGNQESRQRLWACQRSCVDEILDEVRRRLAEQPPAPDYLDQWRHKASIRLPPSPGEQRLRLSPAWAGQLDAPGMAVTTAPMLGGVVLELPGHHLEIDGSWDRRLQQLTPQLWQRWLAHVGAHGSD